uniref:Immunoglobulin like and fibronectin type III domain containing 1, tandem duplicate 1 n=1 Tax=Cyprinus carpio TaxID=7962 RepID=A0A8C2KFP2_CYPCA
MITQYFEELPEGMTTPDFTRKPIALTIQEGKLAIFKAKVIGNPAPTVTWRRAQGEINDPQKFQNKYDPTTNEYTLEIPKVSGDEVDTYKCYASNEYGKAVCTVILNVIEVGFKKDKEMQKADGSKIIEKKEGDIDDSVWELLLSAEKKDYERICIEYGITDYRGMLKKLVEMKKEREEEQAEFIQYLHNLKPIEMKSEDAATFELEMELKDPNSRIFLYKDGVMIPYSKDVEGELKHCLKQVGKKYIFTVKNLNPEDAGIYQVDVEGVNIFSTDFKVPPVDFALKIKEVTAQEREDAIFECVLTQPISKMVWTLKNTPLFNNEKYEITCSEDKLIHCLRIIDCMPLDAGIYAAIAGIRSCSAWLIVEDPATKGKKKARKTTQAGGGGDDLLKVAAEQAERNKKEIAEALEAAKNLRAEREAAEAEAKARAAAEAEAEAAKAAAAAVAATAAKAAQDALAAAKAKVKSEAEAKAAAEAAVLAAAAKAKSSITASTEGITISNEGAVHKLKIAKVTEEFAGKYKFEADGRKTECVVAVEDPPRFDDKEIEAFAKPIVIKHNQKASFKIPFIGREPFKVQWYKDGEELTPDSHCKIEISEGESRLLLNKLQRKDTGEIKIKVKNEFGAAEAISNLVVLDKPTPPVGPLEIVEASANCIEIKWRPPKDNGGCPIKHYILERNQIGRNTWKKIGQIPGEAHYRDSDVDHGRRYCYRIRAETDEGISEQMETEDVQAGTKAYPGQPSAPKVASAFKDCINLTWSPPTNTGGTSILGYNLEKRKKGSNLWGQVNPTDQPIQAKKYAVKDVVEGMEYEFRVSAINISGAGEPSNPSEFVFARDPKMRPRFTDSNIKSFMVVRAGNSARFNINFEASPWPDVIWLKDAIPVSKRVTISNAEGGSQILIPSADRSDTGIYTIIVKNVVGQETFSIEIRVTDEPKPPGPIELDENVPGTVTVSWEPSPDEKRDDRLHYMVTKRDSSKRSWHTVADRIFNNRFTACNIMPGREYQFRVYSKNDIGLSAPSESPKWLITCKKGFPPRFMVPLKIHTPPQGYECYMSCAVRGNPTPHITWYLNNVSLNTDTNYYITNTCGVCSILILRVGAKDMGEYKVIAESSLGRAECTTNLTVRGKVLHGEM